MSKGAYLRQDMFATIVIYVGAFLVGIGWGLLGEE